MNATELWALDKFVTVVLAALLAHGFTIVREKSKTRREEERQERAVRRRLEAELHLALISLVNVRRQLDPDVRGGDCRAQLALLSEALRPLVATQEDMEVLRDQRLTGEFVDWLKSVRLDVDQATRCDLDDPGIVAMVGGETIHGRAPLERAQLRSRFQSHEIVGNDLFERIRFKGPSASGER